MRAPGTRRCHPQLLIRFGYGPEGERTRRAAARPDVRPVKDWESATPADGLSGDRTDEVGS
ncbi:hypothetical protein STRIP9103_09268 [Streptomyces ipomoeae 91-03]|uniref:Uncharacterized protein n=1 Tax=Streptomyces ipomoeae 91-03 TaxID=698759 RepID=L1KHT2_9ACTN|nr:hypothetical protein STRIP9103_09268 [Streptomyces ipomoeae 91-03]